MYAINETTIILTKGDSFYCKLDLARNGETYEPAEDDVIVFGLKKNPCSDTMLIEKQIPNDTLLLHLTPQETAIAVGDYTYDIEVRLANGDIDTVINRERFTIVPEVI